MTTTTAPAQQIPGPEIKEPTLTQQLMLDAPFGDDLCVISARGTGKSWGIAWWSLETLPIGKPSIPA